MNMVRKYDIDFILKVSRFIELKIHKKNFISNLSIIKKNNYVIILRLLIDLSKNEKYLLSKDLNDILLREMSFTFIIICLSLINLSK